MRCTNYDELLRLLDKSLLSREELIFYWDNGLTIRCYSSTGSEETDCFLPEDDPLYEAGLQYWAGVMVLEIIQQTSEKMEYPCVVGEGWAIEKWTAPSKVTTVDGQILWEKQTDQSDWRLMGR